MLITPWSLAMTRQPSLDETEDELFGFLVDERLLPWLEDNAPLVLLAESVLREQARPVLGKEVHIDASHSVYDSGALSGHQRVDRTATAVDDCRVFFVKSDPQVPDPIRAGDVPIAEVKA
jgi:hypothetical protein